jgi:hypothetical protein
MNCVACLGEDDEIALRARAVKGSAMAGEEKVPPRYIQRYRRLEKAALKGGYTMEQVRAAAKRDPHPELGKLPHKSPFDYEAIIRDIRKWNAEGEKDKAIVTKATKKYECSPSVVSRAIALSTKSDP